MGNPKIVLNGTTLIDLTSDTVASNKMLSGVTAHSSSGDVITGTIITNNPTAVSASGSAVIVPSGYYENSITKIISAGSATTPATTITVNPTINVSASGLITTSYSNTEDITPSVVSGYISSGTAGTITVTGSNTSQLNTQEAATINPTESEQMAVASGKYTIGIVKVAAIPSDYVGSNIAQNSSADLIVNGSVITAPSGYYAAAASKAINAGSATTPATSITTMPEITVSSAGLVTATANSSKSITPTVSAGYISSGTAGIVTASGSNTLQLSTQGAATINPTESVQTAVASGKYTTGVVSVGAISSDYIGSNIPQNDSSDLTASGSKVTVPSGYYAAVASKTIAAGSAKTPATTITANPGITVSATGLITATNSKTQNVTPTVTAGYVSAGTSGTITVNGSNTSQLSTQAAATITPTESSQVAVASGKYTTGPVTVAAIPSDYIGSAIASIEIDEGITTVSGTTATRGEATWDAGIIQAGSIGAATFANSSSDQTQYVDISDTTEAPVLVSGGYLYINKGYTDDLKISLAKLVPDGASADLASNKILSGYAAYDNDGNLVAGNIPTKSSSDLTASGSKVTVPSGYYATNVSKAIASASFYEGMDMTNLEPSITVSNTGLITAEFSETYTNDFLRTPGYASQAIMTFSAAGSSSYQLSTQAATTITPIESSQIAVASGKYILGDITVAAVSSDYIGSNIAQNSATDITVSGPTVSVPSGYYAAAASKTIASASFYEGALVPANPTITVSNTGNIVSTVSSSLGGEIIITPGYVSSINFESYASGSASYQLSTQSAQTITPGTTNQTIASGKYLTGVQTILGDANLTAANIAEGIEIFGITGTHRGGGTYQSKIISATESTQTVIPDDGYDALSSVTVNAISSTYIGSGVTQRSSSDLSASGAVVTVPSGYYGADASISLTIYDGSVT